MIKHAYMPTAIISDEVSAFVSQVVKEVANVLGLTIEHVRIRHAQRTHASLKEALNVQTGERQSLWHE